MYCFVLCYRVIQINATSIFQHDRIHLPDDEKGSNHVHENQHMLMHVTQALTHLSVFNTTHLSVFNTTHLSVFNTTHVNACDSGINPSFCI